MSSLTNLAPQKAILAETGMQVDVKPLQGCCQVVILFFHFVLTLSIGTGGSKCCHFSGYIKIKTTTLAKDCAVARMTELVEDAQRKKSKAERLIDSCAKYYIPGQLLPSYEL